MFFVVGNSFLTFARVSCFVLMLNFPPKTLEIRSQELFFLLSIQAAYSIVGTATEDAEDRLSGTGVLSFKGTDCWWKIGMTSFGPWKLCSDCVVSWLMFIIIWNGPPQPGFQENHQDDSIFKGNPYKPSFVTVTGLGLDRNYNLSQILPSITRA